MKKAGSPSAVGSPQAANSEEHDVLLVGQTPVNLKVLKFFATLLCFLLIGSAVYNAYRIRTYALTEYGMVIHEFDPWFNFRATQYLAKHGWHAFFHWFDYMSWYPLGRPVGTTIYPGLQITSVAIHRVLRWLGPAWKMSLNDICCTVPCWFGSIATVFLALITWETTGSLNATWMSAMMFAIIPAHIMRSVGGGYDNESIAITAMLMTFYFWIRSLRTRSSWPIGVITGLAYGYMVAAWGGYVFVLNMVALHAAFCIAYDWAKNKYDANLTYAYSLFFTIGTAIAVCVPPVGMAPFKSLEQLFALLVFVFLIVLHASEQVRRKADVEILSSEGLRIRVKFFAAVVGALFVLATILAPTGFFGPLSSRVRALFMTHSRTGNPLVDSVAEHQPANAEAYWHYLHLSCYGWQIGIFIFPLLFATRGRAASFMLLYSIVAYYFSLKMSRLILLSGPVAASSTCMIVGYTLDWAIDQFFWSKATEEEERLASEFKDKNGKALFKKASDGDTFEGSITRLKAQYKGSRKYRMAIAALFVAVLFLGRQWRDFEAHAESMAHSFANPQLMFKSRMNDGSVVMIDDYREAYFWLRDKTPEDSRVMAWWDYGYQITGIGNRTSIADGNTWNHEHIATLGKCLTSPVPEAHSLIRHLADYVLVWAGGGGDDLAKSPHMARIGNSVYHDICPNDPLCAHFGFKGPQFENPTPMMRKSLLYNLHAHNQKPGVHVDTQYFTEAYTTKYGLVRIFKVTNVSEESKKWSADPANRECDAPGSWYCVGQYPPAQEIKDLMAKRTDFSQLEDMNKDRSAKAEAYHKAYMQRMAGAH